jgi:hypothetical protein
MSKLRTTASGKGRREQGQATRDLAAGRPRSSAAWASSSRGVSPTRGVGTSVVQGVAAGAGGCARGKSTT